MRALVRRLLVAAVSAALVAPATASSGVASAQTAPTADYQVLVVGKTLGFRHSSIDEATRAIIALGAANGFTVDVWDPPTPAGAWGASPGQPELTLPSTPFTSAADLARYEAVVFVSTVDGTNDLDPTRPTLLDGQELAALQGYVRAGGGFAGIHAATDAMHTVPWYGRLTGGGARFLSHPEQQMAVVVTEDPTHPSTAHLPPRWSRFDEWYAFTADPRPRVHVLQTLDESTYRPGRDAMGEDHPISWCQNVEGGRSWYQGMGHTEASYTDPLFLRNVLGGIQWAAGVVEGGCGTFAQLGALLQDLRTDDRLAPHVAASLADRLSRASSAYEVGSERRALSALRQLLARAEHQIRGDADDEAVRAQVTALAGELVDWLEALDTAETAPGVDACPNGWSTAETVAFGPQDDSGVPNRGGADGCTLLDRIWAAEPFTSPGAFSSAVGLVTREFQRAGLLSAAERRAVLRAAASSQVGRTAVPAVDNSCAFRVALTFDDGPSAFRPQTLRTLRELQVPVTFFDIGMRVAANPQLVRAAAQDGHTVLNHTYTHPNVTTLTAEQVRAQVLDTEAALAAAGAPLPYEVFRPPFGALNDLARAELASLGYRPVTWDVLSPDWDVTTTAAMIRDRLVAGLRPGALVLLHDGPVDSAAGAAVEAALPQVVERARARGFCFGRVDADGQVAADRLTPTADPVPGITAPVPYLPLGAYSGDQLPPAPYVIVQP